MTDSPDLAIAKQLLDIAKSDGFAFERIAPGPDGLLRGVRQTVDWLDEISNSVGSGSPARAALSGGDGTRWSSLEACRWPNACAETR